MVLVILNPYFTFDKYSKENIPWHKHWISGQPIENYICYAITIFTYFKTKFKTEQMTSILNILILIFFRAGLVTSVCSTGLKLLATAMCSVSFALRGLLNTTNSNNK